MIKGKRAKANGMDSKLRMREEKPEREYYPCDEAVSKRASKQDGKTGNVEFLLVLGHLYFLCSHF